MLRDRPSNSRLYALLLLGAVLEGCGADMQRSAATQTPAEQMPPTLAAAPQATTPAALAPEPPLASTSSSAASQSGAATGEPAEASITDEQIAGFTEAANSGELEQAKMARLKSQNAEVKKLAGMILSHHGEAQQKQAKLGVKAADSQLTSQLGIDASDTHKKLDGATGQNFDRIFVATQVELHRKLLDILARELLPNAKNPALKSYLAELRPQLQQHLEAAERLQRSLASAAPQAPVPAK